MTLHNIKRINASTLFLKKIIVFVIAIGSLRYEILRSRGSWATISKVESSLSKFKTNTVYTPKGRDNSIINKHDHGNKPERKIIRNGDSLPKRREKSREIRKENKRLELSQFSLSHKLKSRPSNDTYPLTKKPRRREKIEEIKLAIRLNKTKLDSLQHYLSHIPKSGSTYAMLAINTLIFNSTEFHSRPRSQRFRSCMVTLPIHYWNFFPSHHNGLNCTLHMAESPCETQRDGWQCPAPNNYVILREPREHVLSQYFHCKESRDHKKLRHVMPNNLNTWLKSWIRIKEEETTNGNDDVNNVYKKKKFACYNPVNSQSHWMAAVWNKTFLDGDLETRKNFLSHRYTVVGDQSQMDKTVCMITIYYAGWVPNQCNCSSSSSVTSEGASDKVYAGPIKQVKRMAHGVKNHGGTRKTNRRQDQMIAKLRDVDELLYEAGKAVFEDQVKEVELKYNVQICDKYTHRK